MFPRSGPTSGSAPIDMVDSIFHLHIVDAAHLSSDSHGRKIWLSIPVSRCMKRTYRIRANRV